MSYELVESGCVPYELTKDEYEKCVLLVKKMRMKDFTDALEKAVQTLGKDVVAEKIKRLDIL